WQRRGWVPLWGRFETPLIAGYWRTRSLYYQRRRRTHTTSTSASRTSSKCFLHVVHDFRKRERSCVQDNGFRGGHHRCEVPGGVQAIALLLRAQDLLIG